MVVSMGVSMGVVSMTHNVFETEVLPLKEPFNIVLDRKENRCRKKSPLRPL